MATGLDTIGLGLGVGGAAGAQELTVTTQATATAAGLHRARVVKPTRFRTIEAPQNTVRPSGPHSNLWIVYEWWLTDFSTETV
ncbi:hypothetical protein [Tessaracoccus sp.]